jgi:hypothetical protein
MMLQPAPLKNSLYGVDPSFVNQRSVDLPDMTGVSMKELFPSMPAVIKDPEQLKRAIRQALSKVDMQKIRPDDSVNICISHTGFTLQGGFAYAELIRGIHDEISERTGNRRIRLRAGGGLRFRENESYLKTHQLYDFFENRVKVVAPVDMGVSIETEIGTVYGLKQMYDADWFIHVHHSDVRELHFHRQLDRALKSFAMSYARAETRSAYHQNFGPRSANFLGRAIFDSEFVQSKYVFSSFLIMSPDGTVAIDADNDLYRLNDRVNITGLKYFGRSLQLLSQIPECLVILDCPAPIPYVTAGGVIFANFVNAHVDLFDLNNSFPPYTWYTETFHDRQLRPMFNIPPLNPAIKHVIHNYAWGGYPSSFFAEKMPTTIVGHEQVETLNRDSQNLNYVKHSNFSPSLLETVTAVKREKGVKYILAFDGATGGFNVNKELADLFKQLSPDIDEKVSRTLLPMWLKQRGLDIQLIDHIEKDLSTGV